MGGRTRDRHAQSNPSRPFDVAKKWAEAVNREWWLEGDLSIKQGVPMGPMSKRPVKGNGE
jgi:hypothetical protein